ncbi:MAG: Gfo/Idh/MocA family oxidoreductase [Ruminococcaceae bacterium]|nr:Gfo/Idh/MocA family oxidoreductase [Oscillospiraceae bacterium]
MEKKIKLGVFGGSGRGASFIKIIQNCGGEIVAMCDKYEGARNSWKESIPDITCYDNFDAFIEHEGLEAVLLSNYFYEHAPFAIRCLEKGIHVLSECTANGTMADGVALCRAVEKSDAIYMLAENYPFMCANLELERLYKGGTLGNLCYAEGEYVHPVSPKEKNGLAPGIYHWRNWIPRSYYITHALAPLMQMTDAMPTRVTAMAAFNPDLLPGTAIRTGDSAAIMLLQTDKDAIMRVTGCAGFAPHGNWYRLSCVKGSAEVVRGDEGSVRLCYNHWSKPEEDTPTSQIYKAEWKDLGELAEKAGHGGGDFWVIHNFFESIRKNQQPYWNVYRATAMASAAILGWRSILEGGKPYDIPDFSKEEDRVKYENDNASPFPDENGNVTLPCSSKPFAPTEADIAAAKKDWGIE